MGIRFDLLKKKDTQLAEAVDYRANRDTLSAHVEELNRVVGHPSVPDSAVHEERALIRKKQEIKFEQHRDHLAGAKPDSLELLRKEYLDALAAKDQLAKNTPGRLEFEASKEPRLS